MPRTAVGQPLALANGGLGGQWRDHRQVADAILWQMRTRRAVAGDVPERYGP